MKTTKTAAGYEVLKRGTPVEFLRCGVWRAGKVVAVYFDLNRKPGAGRVSYAIASGAMLFPFRSPAANVRIAVAS